MDSNLVTAWRTRQARRLGAGYDPRPAERPADMAGAEDAQAALEAVITALQGPPGCPRSVLLTGMPGTGKTLFARAAAGGSGAGLLSITGGNFESADHLLRLLALAARMAPAVVLMEGAGGLRPEAAGALAQWLAEPGPGRRPVVVILTEREARRVPAALRRAGAIDLVVPLRLPAAREREAILRAHTQRMALAPRANLSLLARATTGFSGADLARLCDLAAGVARARSSAAVTMDDFERALDRLLLEGTRAPLVPEPDRHALAVYQAGRALAAWLLPEAVMQPGACILAGAEPPAGEDLPFERKRFSRGALLARLVVLLSGRAAEEHVLGSPSTLARADLRAAARLARRMVSDWGMGETGLFPLTRARLDEGVQALLAGSYQSASALALEHRPRLDALLAALLKEEFLSPQRVEALLGARSSCEAISLPDLLKIHS